MRKTLEIFIYNYKGLVRNFKANAIMFILPIVFMGIFAVAFGTPLEQSYSIGLIKSQDPVAEIYSQKLQAIKFSPQSDTSVFRIQEYTSLITARKALEDNDIVLFVEWLGDSVNIVGNESEVGLGQALAVLEKGSNDFFGESAGRVAISTIGESEFNLEGSGFDLLAPGLIIYGLLIMIPGIAEKFTQIREKRYIFRYFNSKAQAIHIIGGTVLFYTALAMIQVVILFITATIFGYSASANANIPLAVLVAIPSAIFVSGLALLIGGFVPKPETATNLGSIISIVFGFFSGSFIVGISNVLEFEIFGREFSITELFPTSWATEAMEKVLSEGLGFGDITTELAVISVSALITFAVGVIVYQQRQLKAV